MVLKKKLHCEKEYYKDIEEEEIGTEDKAFALHRVDPGVIFIPHMVPQHCWV